MVHLQLTGEWKAVRSTSVRGHAYVGARALSAAEIANLLDGCPDAASWTQAVRDLNGAFSAISVRTSGVLAAVDRLRTIPVFYGRSGASFYVSDNANQLRAQIGADGPDPTATAEFLLTGYATGSETLVRGISQLRAAEMLDWDDATQSLRTEQYYAFRHERFLEMGPTELLSHVHGAYATVFNRLATSTTGRQLLVPLSGGHDSRLIAIWLKEFGVTDVLCFSYGTQDNWESQISRELAKYLGYPWRYVRYEAPLWKQWAARNEFADYLQFAGNMASVPHVQDWPAIAALIEKKEIEGDCIVIPGHSGDFLAGSHIPSRLVDKNNLTGSDVISAVLSRHYSLRDWSSLARKSEETFAQRVSGIIGGLGDVDAETAADAFERWDLEERQAKFICNSVRTYDYFGLDWRLPLFDYELMDFWCTIPVEQRYMRRLYFDYVRTYQQLPVRGPNTDRAASVSLLIKFMDNLRFRELGVAARKRLRQRNWSREYENCTYSTLGWFGAVDREFFRKTYRGIETLHSYMAVRYLFETFGHQQAADTLIKCGYPLLADFTARADGPLS